MRPTPAMERARRGTNPKPVSAKQRRYLGYLARKAGVEPPQVIWAKDASEAIAQLELNLRQMGLGF